MPRVTLHLSPAPLTAEQALARLAQRVKAVEGGGRQWGSAFGFCLEPGGSLCCDAMLDELPGVPLTVGGFMAALERPVPLAVVPVPVEESKGESE